MDRRVNWCIGEHWGPTGALVSTGGQLVHWWALGAGSL